MPSTAAYRLVRYSRELPLRTVFPNRPGEAAFIGILLVFLMVLVGSLSIVSASVRTGASIAAAVLQWISPFFYASLCLKAAQVGSLAGVLGGIGLLLALAAALMGAGHLAISRRGVRA
jgi:hypothetical protein